MTTKKSTQKNGAQSTPAPKLEDRGRALVESEDRDIDTRKHVKFMLNNLEFHRAEGEGDEAREAEAELRDLVTRAERGECLSRLEDIDPECVEAARATLAYIELPGLPDCLTTAAILALEELASRARVQIWYDLKGNNIIEEGGYSLERIARLFQHHPAERIEFEPKRDLAGLVIAAWRHPDCPQELSDALNGFTSDLFNTLNEGEGRVYMTEPYVRALLIEHAAQKGDEGR